MTFLQDHTILSSQASDISCYSCLRYQTLWNAAQFWKTLPHQFVLILKKTIPCLYLHCHASPINKPLRHMYIRNMVLSYTTKKTRHEPIRLWNFFHMIPCFYKKSRHLASLDSHLWMKIYFKAKDIIYEDEDKDLDHFHGWLCTKSV